MAANQQPIFVIQGNFTPARITNLNTASDGSGVVGSTIFPLVTSATDGTRIDGVRFYNSGSATAGSPPAKVFRIFISDTTGAVATNRLIGEVGQGTTPAKSNNAASVTCLYTFDQPIILKAGQIMYVTMSQAVAYTSSTDQTDACAFAGNYNV